MFGAYGFNSDKSKAKMLQSVQLSPMNGEKWKEFIPRLWQEINAIPMGHITEIRASIADTASASNAVYSYSLPDRYYGNGNVYDLASITSYRNAMDNDGMYFEADILALFSDGSMLPTNIWKKVTITTDGTVNVYRSGDKNAAVPAATEFTIYYIP